MIAPGIRQRAHLEWIPDGELGTRVTLAKMRKLARDGANDPMVKQVAQRIIRGAGVAPNSVAALRVLFEAVRDGITYRDDPRGIELLSEPLRTLQKGHEDCDGKATLLAAMILSLGHPAQVAFRAISTRWMKPREFRHVYAVARLGGLTLPLDATYRGTPFLWQYRNPASVLDYAV